jgi:activating signal cointegrator 1
MKAITLLQPWASLVALGIKRIETRSWRTSPLPLLAIHAAQMPPEGAALQLAQSAWVLTGLAAHGIASWEELPLGKILAIGELALCAKISTLLDGTPLAYVDREDRASWFPDASTGGRPWVFVPNQERFVGSYVQGHWAWLLREMVALREPIPALGKQKLWEWIPPEGWWQEQTELLTVKRGDR